MIKLNKFLFEIKAILIIIALLYYLPLCQSQTVVINYNGTSLTPGSSISVPVILNSGSAHIGGFEFDFNYNLDVLTYTGYTLGDNRLTSNSSWTEPTTYGADNNHQLMMAWGYAKTPWYLVFTNQTLVNLEFTFNGGTTNITFYKVTDPNYGGSYLVDDNVDFLLPNNWYTDGSASGTLATITSNSGGGLWSSGASWDLLHTPNTSNGNVIINSVPATPLVMDANNSVNGDMTINKGGALTINSGKTLTVSGNFLINSDASGTGSFINKGTFTATNYTVQRYLPAWPSDTSSQGWHQISSPVADNSLTNFTTGSYDFFKWSEPTVKWLDQKIGGNNITSFQNGIGYMVSYQTVGTHNFSGSLTTADVSPTITYTVQTPVNPTGQGWNLIGNPFTSAIDATNINSWTKTNVNSYVAVYDDAISSYQYWNGSVGNLTGNVIPAMQAFWVKSNAASPSITIPAANRVHNAQNLYKSSTPDDVVRLTVTSQNGYSDEAFVYFSSSATNGLDEAIDVPKLASPSQVVPQIYSLIGTDKYAINAMGELTSISVPVGFLPGINGTFTIKANELSSFVNATTIDLQDLKTGTYQKLMQNDTYTFTANTTDDANRFVLHFNKALLGIDENKAVSTYIFSYGNDIFVNSTENAKQIAIYNTIGQLIYSVENNPAGMFKYSLNGTTGYYIVRVITDKNVSSEKVFVK